MAVYGDSSTESKCGLIPYGGYKVQPGCATYFADATFYVPTTFQTVQAIVISNNDGSCFPSEVPCISSGYLKVGLTNTAASKIINFVAFGF
jgi:hypothetical protein